MSWQAGASCEGHSPVISIKLANTPESGGLGWAIRSRWLWSEICERHRAEGEDRSQEARIKRPIWGVDGGGLAGAWCCYRWEGRASNRRAPRLQ